MDVAPFAWVRDHHTVITASSAARSAHQIFFRHRCSSEPMVLGSPHTDRRRQFLASRAVACSMNPSPQGHDHLGLFARASAISGAYASSAAGQHQTAGDKKRSSMGGCFHEGIFTVKEPHMCADLQLCRHMTVRTGGNTTFTPVAD